MCMSQVGYQITQCKMTGNVVPKYFREATCLVENIHKHEIPQCRWKLYSPGPQTRSEHLFSGVFSHDLFYSQIHRYGFR